MKKVVLMSMDGSEIEQSPAKYQLLEELHERGYETYVFFPGKMKRTKCTKPIDYIIDVGKMSIREIRRELINLNPQVVIGVVFVDALVLYFLPVIMKNTAFYYYNLEIYTPYLHKDIKKERLRFYVRYKLEYPINKLKEIIYTRLVKAFTIQDPLRGRLSRKYHIWHPNTIYIPNSYVFDEAEVISDDRIGIVYTGGIKRDFFLKQIDDLQFVKNVPVTFSGFMDRWGMEKTKKLRRTNPNMKFVNQLLPIDEYTNYMKQFAVGLVWYSPLKEDEANYYIGLSSGKMFKHFSLGQPVIAVRCPGVTEIVNRYKLGVVIDNISELEGAYDTIMENYSYYRQNVIKTYQSRFDFKKVIVPFLDCIEKYALEEG